MLNATHCILCQGSEIVWNYDQTRFWACPCARAAQGIAARSDETLQAAQPVGQEPGPEGMRPDDFASHRSLDGAVG